MDYDKEAKRVYNIMFNWREELKGGYLEEGYSTEPLEKFIETEIIKKLIDDATSRSILGFSDEERESIKQHLLAKWLGKENV